MRNLKRYLARRKITDIQSWLRSSGFSTIDELASFCKANNLHLDSEEYIDLFAIESAVPVSKEAVQPTSKVVSKVKKDSSDVESKAWHTPAAKRPLAKQKPDVSTSTKTKKPRGSSNSKS